MIYLGLMSGTSCDGIDVAVVEISGEEVNCLATNFQAYPKDIKNDLLSIIAGRSVTARQLSQLDCQLARLYAEAVLQTLDQNHYQAAQIKAIGLHGHTIDHNPPHNTWQIGSAAHVAALTGIDVISDFRTMDVALGGQGAPLAPALHQAMFNQGEPIAVLNLGGIANLSYVTANEVLGFDTGPANCLMDLWISQHSQHSHDESGRWAATGSVNRALLKSFMGEPYFLSEPPKSTGRELFNQNWLSQHLSGFSGISAEDVQATLLALTAQSIAQDIEKYAPDARKLIVCGGGVHNDELMAGLKKRTAIPVVSSASLGVDPDYVESILMAWLASKYPKRLNLTPITGAESAHVFGVLYPHA
mgnify:CR=1 FL=1